MRILIKLCYFLLALYYVATETVVEYKFEGMSLGHSGLLIYWKSNITNLSEEKTDYEFAFKTRVVGDGNHKSYSGKCKMTEKQYKIHSLNENTLYEVTVEQYKLSSDVSLRTYTLKMKTNVKSNRIPAKPHFELIGVTSNTYKIKWYPCGSERICNNQESGTHFGVTIKDPYGTRRNEESREVFYNDYVDILFLSGRMYEVNVYSINGDSKTDSDSRNIFFKPSSSLVQYVRIISLPDSSVLISWKRPKDSMDKLWIIYNVLFWKHTKFEKDYFILDETQPDTLNVTTLFEQVRIFDRKPDVSYTYLIMPGGNNGYGFEYRLEHKLQVYNDDLEIAKPDFDYKLIPQNGTCQFYFQWLPCGQSFNCKNTRPGSKYSFQFRPEPLDQSYVRTSGYYAGHFDMDLKYYVTVNSSIGSNFSESATKIFKHCNEIREDIVSGEKSEN